MTASQVAVVLAASVAVVGLLAEPSRTTVWIATGLAVGAAAAWVDAVHLRLPNGLVAGVAACALAASPMARWPDALVVAAISAGPVLAVHLARPAGVGFGDVKLMAALGALVTPVAPLAALIALLGALAWLIVVPRRGARPLGPPIVVAVSVLVAGVSLAGVG